MAPIRRYLRITKYSVLECRIYLDNPALAESWLLRTRDPVLPRVIESIRPLVLPKLREEKERSKGKSGSKKKGVKDVIVEDDFEVSIFLTETSTRHSLLFKQKHFREHDTKAIQSNSSKLMGATNETAIEVGDAPAVLREDSDEDHLGIQDIPMTEDVDGESDAGSLFVSDDDGHQNTKRKRTSAESGTEPSSKRRKDDDLSEEVDDDKKKMAMETTYDGFSIYGRVLCLVIKRKDKKGKVQGVSGGQAMMEDWITSTQMPQDTEG